MLIWSTWHVTCWRAIRHSLLPNYSVVTVFNKVIRDLAVKNYLDLFQYATYSS